MGGFKKEQWLFLVGVLCLSSCTPTVRLETKEPVQIDVNMKVDVTSRDQTDSQDTSKSKNQEVELSAAERQRNRMMEVQSLKNDRVIGERNDGLIEVRNLPNEKEYARYAKQIVAEENQDRKLIFEEKARETKRPEKTIRKEYADARRQSAFPGEWIQEPEGDWRQR
ncbi:MAG: DUF1318 domain-containing protein [Verrucomicrobiota bacterium]